MSKIRTALVLFLLSSTPLQAATIDEAGATKLKASLEKMMSYQKRINEAFSFEGDVQVIYEGELKVTPETEQYAVEFPKISIKGKTEDGTEDTLDLGVIKMNAIPTDKDNEWKVSTSLPQPLSFAEGALEIGFENQIMDGVYNDTYGLMKANISFDNITIKSDGKDSGFKLGSFKYVTDMTQEADNTFSGPSLFSIQNLDFKSPDGTKETAHIDELKADVMMKNLHVNTIEEMTKKLEESAKVLETAKKSDAPPSDEDMQKFAELIFDMYEYTVKDFKVTYSAKNINIIPDETVEKEITAINLNNAIFDIYGNNMQSDSGDFGLKINYAGLVTEPANEDSKVTPTDLNLDLKIEKIPYNQLITMGTSTLEMVKTNPEMAGMAGMGALFKVPMILAQSGTHLKISDTYAKGADYKAILEGDIISDMNALTSVTAKLKGVFGGLEQLIDAASKSLNYKDIVQPLTDIKNSGTQTTLEGMPAYSFDLEATPDGKFLVNGKDFSPPPASVPMDMGTTEPSGETPPAAPVEDVAPAETPAAE